MVRVKVDEGAGRSRQRGARAEAHVDHPRSGTARLTPTGAPGRSTTFGITCGSPAPKAPTRQTINDISFVCLRRRAWRVHESVQRADEAGIGPAPVVHRHDRPIRDDQMQKMSKRMSGSCCTIPAPCWMPQPLGECVSHVSQCKTACIELVVTNCDRVDASDRRGRLRRRREGCDGHAGIETIPAFLRKKSKCCLDVPTDAKNGTEHDMVILVHGCRDYYLRWTVSIGTLGLDSCHQIAVDDCPDLVHHWYDHFYCGRGCNTSRGNCRASPPMADTQQQIADGFKRASTRRCATTKRWAT